MSLKEYDRVRIKDMDVTGSIVEIFQKKDGTDVYIVEADSDNSLYDCLLKELEKID